MKKRLFLAATSMLVSPLMSSHVVYAQSGEQSSTLQEIVVTSQRTRQKLLDVPNTVQAFSGSQLNEQGIHDLDDLQTQVPGYLPSKGSGYTQIFIRGIGNSVYVGADPSVVTYIDEVPRIYGSMVSQLVDVDRIEVLKGAQGGLYGRNATGGVVNITTKQPNTYDYDGQLLFDYGEYNSIRAAGYVNIPVSEQVAILASIEHDEHDPVFNNIAPSNPYTAAMFPVGSFFGGPQTTANFLNSHVLKAQGDDQDFSAGDFKVLLEPADNVKITWATDYSNKVDSDGGVIQQVQPADSQAFLVGGLLGGFVPGGAANIHLPPGFIVGAGGKDTFAEGSPTPVDLLDYGTSLTSELDMDHFNVESITAYRYQHTFFGTDLGGNSVPTDTVIVNNHKHFFYQELRVSSSDTGPLHWLGGVTYLDNHFTGDTKVFLFSNPPIDGGLPCPSFLPNCQASHTHPVQEIEDATAYAQVGYDITPDLNVTLSERYLYEHNATTFVDNIVVANNASLVSKEEASIPSATISMKIGKGSYLNWVDDGNIYVRWARGFKAGGINPVANPNSFISAGAPLSDGEIFGPERVDTYEAGLRASFLDNTVRFTGSVFFNDYHNLQNSSAHAQPQFQTAVILAIVNVASARTYGAEETLEWKAAPWLTLGLNAGYLNAEYLAGVPNSPVLAELPIGHSTMTNSPRWMGSFNANVNQPITDDYKLLGNVVESYVGRTIFNFAGTDIFGKPQGAPGTSAYWLTNLRVAVATSDDTYELAFYANNLFNQYYLVQGTSSAAGGVQLEPGYPRIVGGEFIYRFGGGTSAPAQTAAFTQPPVQKPASAPSSYLVFFDFDKSDLTPQATQIVDEAAKNAGPAHVTRITCTGHTDTVGSAAYNMRLSKRRAESVAAELEQQGIPSSEIEIVAKGKTDPLVATGDGVKEPQNRRVQIVYEGGPTS